MAEVTLGWSIRRGVHVSVAAGLVLLGALTLIACGPRPAVLRAVTNGSGAVLLTWEPATGDVSGYRVYRWYSGDPSRVLVTSFGSAGTTHNTTCPLSTGCSYAVVAYNNAGEGPESNRAYVGGEVPGPASLTATVTSAATGAVRLDWIPPTGGSALSGYRVYRWYSGDPSRVLVTSFGSAGTTHNTTCPLSTGCSYAVVAYNNAGEGPESNHAAVGAFHAAAAAAPGSVSVTPSGTNSLAFAPTLVANQVWERRVIGGQWSQQGGHCPNYSLGCEYRVVGRGGSANNVSPVFLLNVGPPSAPLNVTLAGQSGDQVHVSWDPPAASGGFDVSRFVVEAKADPKYIGWVASWTAKTIVDGTVRSTVIRCPHWDQGARCKVRVTAQTIVGAGPASLLDVGDDDGDGLVAEYETLTATSPTNPDTDGDTVMDGAEDYDGDGYTNLVEQEAATRPDDGAHTPCVKVTRARLVSPPSPPSGSRELSSFLNCASTMGARWVPDTDDGFVGQGVATGTNVRYLSGYLHPPSDDAGDTSGEWCRLYATSLTGAVTSVYDFPTAHIAAVAASPGIDCKHGGGVAFDGRWIYVADTDTLLVLDSQLLGTASNPIVNVAQLNGIRGSYLMDDFSNGRLWIGTFDEGPTSELRAYPLEVLRTADEIAPSGAEPFLDLGLAKVQGAALVGSTIWATSSRSACGTISKIDVSTGAKTTYPFAPGAEEVEVVSGQLVSIHEAGAVKYPDEFFPVVANFDPNTLRQSSRGCTP